ncbi:MAG: glycosyltransferase, partial [Planctomycetales bacterium]|nr:glycosyltransferase [Planctomycetales bacterium]
TTSARVNPLSYGPATDMQKIGYVLKVFPRLSQTFVINELQAHQRAGVDITIFSLKPPKDRDIQLVAPGVDFPLEYLTGDEQQWADELASRCRRLGITQLHAHFGNIATQTARLASQQTGIPYTFTAHALDIFADKVDTRLLADKIRNSAGVVTVSQFNVRHLLQSYGRRAALVYNGMPLAELPFDDCPRAERLILGVGRLIEKKGFSHLVDACRELVNRGVSFRCEIIGDGPLEHSLRAQIDQLGLQDRVMLSGALAPPEVKKRIRQANILAAPCVVAKSGDRDGLPTVLLEAMALGTPCVSTDVTGIPEVIVDGLTGRQVSAGNSAQLASACQSLLEDDRIARQLARRARRLIEERFDSDRTAAELRRIWERPPRRLLFRIHNRRGMGHWMRGTNIAEAITAIQPAHDILFFNRAAPPFPVHDGFRYALASDPDSMRLPAELLEEFAPHVIVDDTILRDNEPLDGVRRVLIMRKLTAEKQQSLFASRTLRDVNLVLVPHTREEFGYELPAWLEARTRFVGPIVRQPVQAACERMRQKYRLSDDDFLLVSTPGGGGFDADAQTFFETVRRVHTRVRQPRLRHLVVRGPNSAVHVDPMDEQMTVVDAEPEINALFALAHAVISAGGYNSVNEIRASRRPAFYLPGERKYDDQRERVQALATNGLAWVVEGEPMSMASQIAKRVNDSAALSAMAERCADDPFIPGNQLAAEAIVACAQA